MLKQKSSARERFQRFYLAVPESGCWLWLGTICKSGYGRFRDGSKLQLAHRYSYSIFRGEISAGLEIDHLCRVRCCVNPNHLEAVSHTVNMKRAILPASTHRNGRKTNCPRGHLLEGKNVILERNWAGGVSRRCRQCAYERNKRAYAKVSGLAIKKV